jgi:carbonic anhydrase/acetyltransferase-like protein (isoleucine patch superfamily)
MNVFGQKFLRTYQLASRIKSKLFSLMVSGAFARFGKRTVLAGPIRLSGEERISLGDGVFVGAGSWLQTLPDGSNDTVAITIGDGTSIAGNCVVSAVRSVVLEEKVLVARNVYISDHIHKYDQLDTPVLDQGLGNIAPVLIERGAWLGQNVVVCPGVTIGRGAVVGANSVVNQDIPDYSVAVGAPARVVKLMAQAAK